MRKLRIAIVMAAAATTLVAETGSAVLAEEPTSSPNTDAVVAALRDRLRLFGIAPDVENTLVEKVLAGERLDADTDASPVSSETTTVNGVEETRNVYADGSVAIGSLESPEASPEAQPSSDGANPLSIRGCNHRVDSFGTDIYTGCEVAWDAATQSVSWTANYDYNVNGSAITSARSVHFGGIGSFSGAGTEIVVLRADRNGTAIADGYVNQEITIAGVGVTRRVGVSAQKAMA